MYSMDSNFTEIEFVSPTDGSRQSALLAVPEGSGNCPLVVGLHTWSFDRHNQLETYLPLCRQRGWGLLLPEFRGPNLVGNPNRATACGSKIVRQDIAESVRHVLAHYPIDPARVFLLGCSGGGMAALLTAAEEPELFAAVDVWCPVTDLISWHRFCKGRERYAEDLEYFLGGTPVAKETEYLERSPISHVEKLKNLALSIHHGRSDTLVPETDSQAFVQRMKAIGAKNFYYDFFDGGHEQFPEHSFAWFERKGRGVGFASGTQITG